MLSLPIITLLGSNLLLVLFAVSGNFSFTNLLVICSIDVIFIGIINFIKILTTHINRKQNTNQEQQQTVRLMKYFFTLIYLWMFATLAGSVAVGIIWVVVTNNSQLSFIISSEVSLGTVVVVSISFFLHHLFSFWYKPMRVIKESDLSVVFIAPFISAAPLLVLVLTGGIFSFYLPHSHIQNTILFFLIFIGMKIVADLYGYSITSRIDR